MIGNHYFGNTITQPRWAADFLNREHLEPWAAKIDPAQFSGKGGIAVVLTAGASATDTSLAVTALTLPATSAVALISAGNRLIPAGTVLDFGGGKFARLTADASAGDTTLTVSALPTAMLTGDTANYSPTGAQTIPSGTEVGRTYAERDASTAFGPAAVGDDEIFLIAFDVVNAHNNPDVTLYRHNSRVKENYLPNWATLHTAANEVQTVAVDTIMSGGKIGITALDNNGVPREVIVAYNTSWTQTVADIQTALNALLGTSAVAAAVTNTHDMTLTWSGTNYAGVAQQVVAVDASAATGPTKVTVTRSTLGGTGVLTKLRQLYQCIKGVD